jgi:beta-alanine degradation protein BauB
MNADERLGSRILLENDSVRVWDDRVGVGETQTLHTHRRPYLAVVVEGDRAETVDADGQIVRTFEFTAGETHYFGRDVLPVTHSLRNTGASQIRVVIIEVFD